MNKIPCSVYIVTLNCEQWIERTLASVSDFQEIIILDSGSTDRTFEIAEKFENVRIRHQDWQGYARQKKLALAECSQEWALNLDGDEILSVGLKQEILRVIQSGQIDGLIVPINDVFLGIPNSKYTKRHAKIRFFRKSKGVYDLSNQVHENIIVSGIIKPAQYEIYHYGESSIWVKVDKNNQYSNLKASEKFQKGNTPSLIKLIFIMPITFFKSYFIRRSFLNGWRGFVNSMINAFYAFLKEAKLFEKKQNSKNNEHNQP